MIHTGCDGSEEPVTFLKSERVFLKNNSEYNENWVQDRIADNPSILGLGKLTLGDRERRQQGAGRLDLLLYDKRSRYEVELQLGEVDGSHIIRTIEYWDKERKLHPQYNHYAVLVAENVNRFLNVIELFINKEIPLIVLQMQALRVGEHITLSFTQVLGKKLAPSVTDKDKKTSPTTHASWKDKIGPERILVVDKMLEISHNFDSTLKPTYNKNYITFKINGRRVMRFIPHRKGIMFRIIMRKSEEADEKVNSSALDFIEYTGAAYSFWLNADVMNKERKILEEIAKLAFDEHNRRR